MTEHILWVVLVAFFGVSPQTGKPTVQYEVHSTHMRPQECQREIQPMIRAAQGNPRVSIQCLPVKHGMIW